MSSNMPNSFFVPETPPTKMGERAAWELSRVTLLTPTDDLKMTPDESKLYHALFDDTSDSDQDVVMLNDDQVAEFQNQYNDSKTSNCGPPFVVENDKLLALQMHEEERAKAKKRCAKDATIKKLRADNGFEKQKKVRMFVPSLVDDRVLFVRDNFVGPENYHTMRAVDSVGTIFKRVVLKDKSVGHNFVMTSTRFMFKLEGEMVDHYTPGARGIVNVTREKRVPFTKLYDQTFENELL